MDIILLTFHENIEFQKFHRISNCVDLELKKVYNKNVLQKIDGQCKDVFEEQFKLSIIEPVPPNFVPYEHIFDS